MQTKFLECGAIIIATNTAGSGTDLKLSKQLIKNGHGGLHVILSYMPRNYRIELQAFGRCARNGQSGTCTYIVCDYNCGTSGMSSIDSLKKDRDEMETI